jgi:ubiquinone/menaquinone biosynthesis C-methylase UbiE
MDALLSALRAAAEPTRMRILGLCAQAELTVSELVHILGQSQPGVSRHLRLLSEAGLLDRVREGSWVFHRLIEDGPGAKMAGLLSELLPADDPVLALDLKRLAEVKEERSRAAADYFRRNAQRWDELRSLYVEEGEVEDVLKRLLPTTGIGDLLDVGTGTGRMLEVFGPRVGRALGIDLSHDMLAVARVNVERSGLKNLALRKGDMYQLDFPDASFDAVSVHQVLHFAENPARALAEAARVLRPGGHLLVADFAPHDLEYLRRDHEHRRLGFDDSQVCDWFEAAFLQLEEIEHLPGDPLTVTVWLASKPGAQGS